MTYTIYQHTIQQNVPNGQSYTVQRFTQHPTYINPYTDSDTVVLKTELYTIDSDIKVIDDWSVIIFGQLFVVSEEHTGRYVFPKDVWETFAKDYDDSVKQSVTDWDWDDYDWLENDGHDYVVFDFGGQLDQTDPDNGYTYCVDVEELLPMIPWNAVNWDLSDVGNG